jgi:ATP-dependent protease ClpP protease subunit
MSSLYLSGDINGEMAGAVLGRLDDGLNRIVLNSSGGSITDAFAIYDAVIGCDIEIVATGACMSAAVIVLLAGRGRYATPNCRFLLHPVRLSGEERPSSADETEAGFLTHVVTDLLHKRGTLSNLKAPELLLTENYFGSSYAKTIGLIHDIWRTEEVAKPGFATERSRN